MQGKKLSRREFLKHSALIGAGLTAAQALAACAPPASGPAAPAGQPAATQAPAAAPTAAAPAAAAGFDWMKYKGETIEVSLTKGSMSDVLQKYQKEFEDLTGITVGSEQMPEQQQRQKLVVEFNAGATSFDALMFSYHVQKRLFGKNQWLEDLRPYLDDKNQTAPDFDWADVSPAGKTWATQADGRIDSLPVKIDYWILYYNAELFEKNGLKAPATFEEMVAAAEKLHDPANNVFGFLARGLKNANTPVWTSFMLGWDTDSVDAAGQMHTDGPEAIAAAELYQRLLKNSGPQGVAGFNWSECQSTFALGQAGMWFDGIGFSAPLEDTTKSKIVGKVGYGVPPGGPKARHSGMFGDGMSLSRFSQKKGPAYLYCQWATGKLMQTRFLTSGAASPARTSPYQDAEALKSLVVPQAWVDTLVECSKIGRPSLPIIMPVTEFRDIFGIALTNMIGGADATAELKKATAEFKPILEKSEQG